MFPEFLHSYPLLTSVSTYRKGVTKWSVLIHALTTKGLVPEGALKCHGAEKADLNICGKFPQNE
jgi:hypothetical protein